MTAPDKLAVPTVRDLFAGFFGIGIMGFGGVLPWARWMVVERRHWLGAEEFTDVLALCQFLPGPNIVNVSVALGSRFRGLRGAAAALTGLLAAPFVIVMLLGIVYARFSESPAVRHAFAGLAAGASGLVIAMAIRIAVPLRRRRLGAGIAVLAFTVIAVLHAPLVPTMLVLAPLSLGLAWRFGA